MASEYSYVPVQTVTENGNVLFADGERACKRGLITHRAGSGIFRLKGATNACKTVYRVQFTGNIAVSAAADGGVLGPISLALREDGEALGNATAIVTPAAIGDFFNVSLSTFVEIYGTCCVTVSVENVSDGTAVDVVNANIIIDRVA